MAANAFEPTNNLGFLLAKAVQSWNDLLYTEFCAAGYADVRPAYGSILMPLFAEDGLQIGELARRAQLSKQTMTTMIEVMERRQLIIRKRDPLDARAFCIYLSRRSRQFKKVVGGVLREIDRTTELHLTRNQIKSLKRSLRTLMNLNIAGQSALQHKKRGKQSRVGRTH